MEFPQDSLMNTVHYLPRPTYETLREWLRSKYDIDIDIITIATFSYQKHKMYGWNVYGPSDGSSLDIIGTWTLGERTYDNSLKQAIKVSLNYIKEKK